MAHLCVPQNQALGVCRGFAPDIQICGTHRRKNLVNATIISNAEEEDTLNVTFPVSRTQSSAPKGSPQVLPRLREKEGKKVPGKMEPERQWQAKRLAHVRLRRGRDALQTLCGACRRQERVIYCRMRCAQAGHEQTQSHIRSSEIAFAILAPDKTAGQQLRRQLTAAQTLKMSTMFRTSHALVLASTSSL